MTKAEEFIYHHEGQQREIMLYLHHALVNEFNLTSKISYKIPFYYRKSWICYLNPTKDNKVELAFTRGNELSNMNGLLEFKGRKQVAGMEFYQLKDIQKKAISEIIHEAILLDDSVPYSLKRKEV
jgi:hypothetical protein